jgi:hypothetical protein
MKRMLISEDEKSRILNLHQNLGYKTSLNEQSVPQQPVAKPATNQTGLTPKQPLKPTLEVGGKKYYVPNLTDASLDSFTDLTGPMTEMDARNYYEKLGIKWALGGFSPFAISSERYRQDMDMVRQNRKELGDDQAFKNAPYSMNFNSFQSMVPPALLAYLGRWRPTITGMNVLQDDIFLINPAIVNLKKYISNFDEVFPKMVNIAAKKSGVQIG